MNARISRRPSASAQRGVAILAITMLLLLVATIATLSIGRVGVNEQKAVGVDIRQKEVYSAAIGGLEYGTDWFKENFEDLSWSGSTVGSTASPATQPDVVALEADTYNVDVTYNVLTDLNPANPSMPVIVEVAAIATAEGDSHITKTIRKEVMLGKTSAFSSVSGGGDLDIFKGPPIMIEGCTVDINGTPTATVPTANDVAVASTTGGDGSVTPCLDTGHLNQDICDDGLCTPPAQPPNGNHSGVSSSASPTVSTKMPPEIPNMSLRRAIFGNYTDQDFYPMLLDLEERNPDYVAYIDGSSFGSSHGRVPNSASVSVTGSDIRLGGTWGDPDNPMIVFLRAPRCLKTQGGLVVYGVLYIETDDPSCDVNGLGNVHIYGTLAKEGDLHRYNANIHVVGQKLDFGSAGTGTGTDTTINVGVAIPQFSEVPGSWRDF